MNTGHQSNYRELVFGKFVWRVNPLRFDRYVNLMKLASSGLLLLLLLLNVKGMGCFICTPVLVYCLFVLLCTCICMFPLGYSPNSVLLLIWIHWRLFLIPTLSNLFEHKLFISSCDCGAKLQQGFRLHEMLEVQGYIVMVVRSERYG